MKTGDGIEKTDELPKIVISPSMRVLTGMLITAMIIAGIYPGHLIELARAAALALM